MGNWGWDKEGQPVFSFQLTCMFDFSSCSHMNTPNITAGCVHKCNLSDLRPNRDVSSAEMTLTTHKKNIKTVWHDNDCDYADKTLNMGLSKKVCLKGLLSAVTQLTSQSVFHEKFSSQPLLPFVTAAPLLFLPLVAKQRGRFRVSSSHHKTKPIPSSKKRWRYNN